MTPLGSAPHFVLFLVHPPREVQAGSKRGFPRYSSLVVGREEAPGARAFPGRDGRVRGGPLLPARAGRPAAPSGIRFGCWWRCCENVRCGAFCPDDAGVLYSHP